MSEEPRKPAYLLTGTDRPKISRALARLRSRFGTEAVETLSAGEASGDEVVAALNALGLFGAGRLVVLHGAERWKKADLAALREYLDAPAPGAVLALVTDEPPRESSLADAVAAAGNVLRYDVPKPKDPSVWVRSEFERVEVDASDEAARRLVEIVGEDVSTLAPEIDKIATWSGGEPVGVREVEALAVPGPGEAPAWVLSDAWGRRDVAAVLAACKGELDRGVEPFLVGVRLAAQVGFVRAVQALMAEGLGAREIATRLKKHEFRVRKAFAHAERYTRDELDAAVVRLAQLDAELKGASRLSAELALERTLVEVTRAAEPATA
jgi:DNA polymerase III subunit delta